MEDWVRITRKFSFEAAHALLGYDGACRHIHGHSYKLEVSVIGIVRKDNCHPKNGMVMDFGDLKKLVQLLVIDEWDHALLLNEENPRHLLNSLSNNGENIIILPYQPSCENMLIDIKERLRRALPPYVKLVRIMLSETENSYAEWYALDNCDPKGKQEG